jgi:class 3 adenylate cyclase
VSSPSAGPSDELVQLREEHQALIDVLRVLGRSRGDEQPVLDVVAETAGRLAGAKTSFLWLTDGDLFRIRAAYGGTEDELAYERAHPHRAEPTTLTGRVVQRMDPVRIPDVLADPLYEWGAQRIAGYRALLGIPIIAEGRLVGVIGMSWDEPQTFPDDQVRLMTAFADQAAIAITNARLFTAVERQREELARFLAPSVASLISSDEGRQLLSGHRAYVTVLFSDLRGFTSFAETAEPEEVLDVLREYHHEIGTLIDELGGTLEHFAGDGVMVFFNDPEPMPDHESVAVRMALALRDRVGVLAAGWAKRGIELGVGIGVAAGHATLGRIGFEGRFDYAAIGPVTNLASRLSSAAAPGQILVSQRLHAAAEDMLAASPVTELTLKGYARPVRAWAVTAIDGSSWPG